MAEVQAFQSHDPGKVTSITPVRSKPISISLSGFRWSRRVVSGQAVRQTRKGRKVVRTLRIAPALQLPAALKSAVGRQLRRTDRGGIQIQSAVAVFG